MRPEERDTQIFVPGRVNLIGEHTDYNSGVALPFAIELGVTITITSMLDDAVVVSSAGFGTWRSDEPPTQPWSQQVAALVNVLGSRGLQLAVTTTLPEGAGLSSSAAFLCAVALALGAKGDARELATLVNQSEVTSGNDVGLLDPLAVLAGRAGHGLLIDFTKTTYSPVEIPSELGFTVVHSGVSRSLATTAYIERRAECRAARQFVSHWPPLSDDVDKLEDPTLRARVRHVVSENQRVRDAVDALSAGDFRTVGRLVSASHASLRDDFEASLPEIDILVEELSHEDGVFGARLVGGGFGGCILVVHGADVDVQSGAGQRWRVHPSDGALIGAH
jgi:galactokinase